MNRANLIDSLLFGAAVLAVAGIAAADTAADPIETLKKCARTDDRSERIACFEALGRQVLEQEADDAPPSAGPAAIAVAAPPESAEAPSAGPAAPATMAPGSGQAEAPPDSGHDAIAAKRSPAPPAGRHHVDRCRQTRGGSWYFYLDNGEEWEQSSDRRYRFETCDFYVTFSKDFFGHKMETDSGRTIRVRRVK